MENFIRKITDMIKNQLGNDYDIRVENVTKNNDTGLCGLAILKKGNKDRIAPTIYLAEFYEDYQHGTPLENIVDDIISLYRKHYMEDLGFDLNDITILNKIKDKIYFQLINGERNTNYVRNLPHISYLDFLIIFRIHVESPNIGTGSIVVNNGLIESWNINEDELYNIALKNTPILMPCRIVNMLQLIDELQHSSDCEDNSYNDFPMFVITNEFKDKGAGCILYPDVIESFTNIIRKDIYLLPSSVHEMLAIPVSCGRAKELKDMVYDVNRTQVSKEEFLSDNIYRYYRDTKEIKIVTL